MKILVAGTVLVFLSALLSKTGAENGLRKRRWVTPFASCIAFFAGRKVPSGIDSSDFRYPTRGNVKQICQSYNNVFQYATLYVSGNQWNIPIYSAYTINADFGMNQGRPEPNPWFVEPSLEINWRSLRNMQAPDDPPINNLRFSSRYQATDVDYRSGTRADLTRGHLYPSQHAAIQNQNRGNDQKALSTFTFTNMAPQYTHSNNVVWSTAEGRMSRFYDGYCRPHTAHVVTGVIPDFDPTPNVMNNKVNIPKFYWSAFCCRAGSATVTFAYLGDNKRRGNKVHFFSLQQLQEKLSRAFGGVTVFPDNMCGNSRYDLATLKDGNPRLTDAYNMLSPLIN